jgi:uncharacterized RDD family membrane protein YckC
LTVAAKIILNPTSSSRREVPLARTMLSIGRDPSNDLVLPDALVSRRHAVIECRSGQYLIRDCNSSNGSLVNGDRITEQPLKDGDLLAIGTARLLFRLTEIEDVSAKVVPHPSSPRMSCPSCQADYRRGDLFCRKCGHGLPPPIPVHVTCGSCDANVPLPANFCNACGAPVPQEESLEPTRPRARVDLSGGPEASPASETSEPSPSSSDVAPAPPLPIAEVAPAMAGGGGAPQVVIPAAPRHTPASRARVAEPIARPSRPVPAPARSADRLASISTAAPLPAAPFGPRLAAGLIDAAIVGVAQGLLVSPGALYFYRLFQQAPSAPLDPGFVPVLLSVALVVVAAALGAGYFVYFWGVKGATPGKNLMGLAVQGEGGEWPIGLGRAVVRLLGYALSAAILGIGFLMIAFGRYGLHDRLAATRVVRARGKA